MTGISYVFAGVPVSDLEASIDWYTRFFGAEMTRRVGDECLWDLQEQATLFIEPNRVQAGAGRITMMVDDLDAFLARITDAGLVHEPVETYEGGVRNVKVPDPDGNAIALAELPDEAPG